MQITLNRSYNLLFVRCNLFFLSIINLSRFNFLCHVISVHVDQWWRTGGRKPFRRRKAKGIEPRHFTIILLENQKNQVLQEDQSQTKKRTIEHPIHSIYNTEKRTSIDAIS